MNSDLRQEPLHVVRFSGPFGFIKPWTAVRDELTYSQSFLTPSIIEGLRQKLGVSAILRHRLRHGGIDRQQERTQSAGWIISSKEAKRQQSIVTRGILIAPELFLAFPNGEEADLAATQHICLCRNEDVLLPSEAVTEMKEKAFDEIAGVELRFERTEDSFLVGFNRFEGAAPMFGHLVISGGPRE